jgi:hypothetical protein
MAALAWGKKVSPEFAQKVVEISGRLRIDPNWLMACMAFETGERFTPNVKNPGSSATGLIQFMRDTAIQLGTTTQALARLTAEDQLDYVEKYFRPYRGKIRSLSDCYMVILWPKGVGKPESYVLFAEGQKTYLPNKGLDVDQDGNITKAEASRKVHEKLRRGLQAQFVGDDDALVNEDPLEGDDGPVLTDAPLGDDNTRWSRGVSYPEVRDVQVRLKALHYSPGIIDGKWGGATAGAIKAFRTDRHLEGPTAIDAALLESLDDAEATGWKRPVSKERQEADDDTIAEAAPELNAVKSNRLWAGLASVGTFIAAAFNGVTEFFGDAWEKVQEFSAPFARVPGWVWFVGAGGFSLWLWIKSQGGVSKIREQFKTGERL